MSRHEPKSRPGTKKPEKSDSETWTRKIRRWRKRRNKLAQESRRRNR